jgi:hypothetical protein
MACACPAAAASGKRRRINYTVTGDGVIYASGDYRRAVMACGKILEKFPHDRVAKRTAKEPYPFNRITMPCRLTAESTKMLNNIL